MIAVAVITVPGGGGGISPLTRFGGLSLLKRAILTAQKAGAKTCYVVEQVREDLKRELQNDSRITSRLVWKCPYQKGPPKTETGRETEIEVEVEKDCACLVFAYDTVFRHPSVQELARQATSGQAAVAPDVTGVPMLAVTPCACIPTLLEELRQGKALHETTTVSNADTVQTRVIHNHFLRRLASRSAVATLERDLLLSLENPRDGVVDTYLNRHFSRPLTRWLLRTPLSPNQVTLLAGLVSILGALCFVLGGYFGPLLGALLLQFSAVLDCCDGEVARIKYQESPLGDWLDIVCDTVGAIAIFLGIGVALWRNGAGNQTLMLAGVLAVGGGLAFLFVTQAEKTENEGDHRNGWEDRLIKVLLKSLTNRDYSILILFCAVVGKLSWFLWGAAIGAQVFWLSLAWLLLRTGRLSGIWRIWEGRGL